MDLLQIKAELEDLQFRMRKASEIFSGELNKLHPSNRISGENLLHYLVLRSTDIQNLQNGLHLMGLSSLASCESHALRQIQVTLERLGQKILDHAPSTLAFGEKKIKKSSRSLFGKPQKKWLSNVMVTFDRSFLEQPSLINDLLNNGMSVARINCAHDDETIWLEMVKAIRNAEKKTRNSCKIHFDLAGPKIRTVFLKKGKKKGKTELQIGQKIWLSDTSENFEKEDIVISPNETGVIDSLEAGERVLFDDGMILCVVKKKFDSKALLEGLRISSKKPLLKAEKGINFPDTILHTPSLTDYDRACLPFVCNHADTVGFSFVRTREDLQKLRQELKVITEKSPFIILKIETQEAVRNFPSLLLEGLTDENMGVMIARGDLAVEIGFERMVEVQEEISWLCEAAHVPVIWATQVLESLHKSGLATRAEITDAGRAAMAECIMINKGAHTLQVLKSLRDIAQRSQGLKRKNRLLFRPLGIAEKFLEGE
jgi:pyruvate kinase